jgi:hypothetical protein
MKGHTTVTASATTGTAGANEQSEAQPGTAERSGLKVKSNVRSGAVDTFIWFTDDRSPPPPPPPPTR